MFGVSACKSGSRLVFGQLPEGRNEPSSGSWGHPPKNPLPRHNGGGRGWGPLYTNGSWRLRRCGPTPTEMRRCARMPDSGGQVRGPLSNSPPLRHGRGYATRWPCGKHGRVSSVNSAISRIAGAKLGPPPCGRALCPHGHRRPCSILLRRRGHQAAEQVFFVLTQQHVYRHPNELALVDAAALEALLPQFRP